MDGPLFDLLYKCTVQLIVPGGLGTGFFVAPGLILTCAHVVEPVKNDLTCISVKYNSNDYTVENLKLRQNPYPDLALLRIDYTEHPCVYLDAQVRSRDELFAYGYTREYPAGASTTIDYEGSARVTDQEWFLKFKGGQIIPGYSGGPILNINTWGICGVVKSTRDKYTDLGGGGIPSGVILVEFPELVRFQDMFHNYDPRWSDARREQTKLTNSTEPRLPVKTISVLPAVVSIPTPTIELQAKQLNPTSIIQNIYSPLSVDWYAENSVALGSRDGYIQLVGLDGQIQKKIKTTAYPSYVAVYNQKQVAAICYTKLYVVDLETGNERSVEIDPRASSYVVAWSPDGAYIAVGSTNGLCILNTNLILIAEHHLGGKYGAKAATWATGGNILYVGLGNGELWCLTAPFNTPSVLIKGPSGVLALQHSELDDRFACLWQDGTLEIRNADTILASMVIKTEDSWSTHGPKLAWCMHHKLLICITGLSTELVLWQLDSGTPFSCQFERNLLAINVDPADHNLIIGLDERQRGDAELLVISLDNILTAFTETNTPLQKRRPDPHLLTADWTNLHELVDDTLKQVLPGFIVKLDIPSLRTHLDSYEESLRKFNGEPGILRILNANLKKARQDTEAILDTVSWVSQQMKASGYSEQDVSVVCDRTVSFSVNSILGKLGIHGFPQLISLDDFVAFTLGYDKDDLVYMGFDGQDGRGHVANVPIDFLMNINELVSIGGILGKKYDVKTLREKVYAGCQLFHDFDYIFSHYEKIQLWTKFVLPIAVLRYPREEVVIRPGEITSYGLA